MVQRISIVLLSIAGLVAGFLSWISFDLKVNAGEISGSFSHGVWGLIFWPVWISLGAFGLSLLLALILPGAKSPTPVMWLKKPFGWLGRTLVGLLALGAVVADGVFLFIRKTLTMTKGAAYDLVLAMTGFVKETPPSQEEFSKTWEEHGGVLTPGDWLNELPSDSAEIQASLGIGIGWIISISAGVLLLIVAIFLSKRTVSGAAATTSSQPQPAQPPYGGPVGQPYPQQPAQPFGQYPGYPQQQPAPHPESYPPRGTQPTPPQQYPGQQPAPAGYGQQSAPTQAGGQPLPPQYPAQQPPAQPQPYPGQPAGQFGYPQQQGVPRNYPGQGSPLPQSAQSAPPPHQPLPGSIPQPMPQPPASPVPPTAPVVPPIPVQPEPRQPIFENEVAKTAEVSLVTPVEVEDETEVIVAAVDPEISVVLHEAPAPSETIVNPAEPAVSEPAAASEPTGDDKEPGEAIQPENPWAPRPDPTQG